MPESLPRAANVIAGERICPRCLATDHQKIKLVVEHRSMLLIAFYWYIYCPRCGWTKSDEEIEHLRQPFRFLFIPRVIIRRRNWVYQTTIFTLAVKVGILAVIWLYIFPQLLNQIETMTP